MDGIDVGDTYWANLTGKLLAEAVLKRFNDFQFNLRENELESMRLFTLAYYGEDDDGDDTTAIVRKGSQGQIRKLMDNETRAVVQNKLAIVTADPGGFLPVPINSDADSQATSMLTRGVLDYYFKAKGGDQRAYEALEQAEALHWSWLDVPWNEKSGPVVDKLPQMGAAPAEGAVRPMVGVTEQRAGDVEVIVRMPTEVAFSYDSRRPERQWLIIQDWANKWDLAAEAEARGDAEMAAKIRRFNWKPATDDIAWVLRPWTSLSKRDEDEVPVYELRHIKTAACPEGRWMRCLDADLVLDEGPERYFTEKGSDLGCYMVASAARYGTPRAYSGAHDMLGLQRAVDTLTSILHSNEAGLGLNVLVTFKGTEVRPEDIRKGLLNVEVAGDKSVAPEVLSLARTAPEIGENRMQFKSDMAGKAGMDSLSMGRDNRQLAASAMALLDTKTQRAVSGARGVFNRARRDVAGAILRRYAQFAKTGSRTLAMVAGKSKRLIFSEFTGGQLGNIDRVEVEDLSPILRDPSGRMEALRATTEAQRGGVPPEVAITFMETGKWEGFNEGPMAEVLIIREENERLLAGEELDSAPPPVDPTTGQPIPPPLGAPEQVATAIIYDNPIAHITGHRPVSQSLAARRNPTIMRNLGNHLAKHEEHAAAWLAGDPRLVAIHGPPPGMPAPAGPPPGGPAPGEKKPPPGGGGKEPKEPKVPSTGQQWTPTGGMSNG